MTLEELISKYFFNENDFSEFKNDLRSLDVVELKNLAVNINRISEERKMDYKKTFPQELMEAIDLIENFNIYDLMLVSDKVKSKISKGESVINQGLSLFSNDSIRLIELIEYMDNETLKQVKKIIDYYIMIYEKDKQLVEDCSSNVALKVREYINKTTR